MVELDEVHCRAESRLLALNHAMQTRLQAYDDLSNASILVSNHCAVRLQLPSTLGVDHLVHFEKVFDGRLDFGAAGFWDGEDIVRSRHSDRVREPDCGQQHLVVECDVSLLTGEDERKSPRKLFE